MTAIKQLLLHTRKWVTDPFGRKELLEKHEEVLGRIRETTAAVSVISQERFPISRMVGHSYERPKRRSAHYGN